MKNKPEVLANDIDALCVSAGNFFVRWCPPNYPDGNPIEGSWSEGKTFAQVYYSSKRNMATLCNDLRLGMYTATVAKSAVFKLQGWKFYR